MRPRTTVAPSGHAGATTLNLGRELRPVIFGGTPGAPNAFAGSDPSAPPELVLSVHSRAGCLLGYVVVERGNAGQAVGGMTIAHDLDLSSTIELARATALQVRFLGLAMCASHCLVLVEPDLSAAHLKERLEEYVYALRPLVAGRLCAIMHTTQGLRLEPRLAREGAAASTAAATLAVLDRLGVDPGRARVALHRPSLAAQESVQAITDRGPRVIADGDAALTADVDVLVVGRPLLGLDAAAASTIRARAVVAVGAASLSKATERRLHERRIVVIPDTVAGAGVLLALDLRARGLDERAAVDRTFATVEEQARDLLDRAAAVGRPLSSLLRD